MKTKKQYHYGLGRRKTSTARVYLEKGDGKFFVNKREFANYFPVSNLRNLALMPLALKNAISLFNMKAFVKGGGVSSQAGAIRLGIARALLEYNAEWRSDLKKGGLLTRDSRVVERKKYGQKGARAKFQYSKR
jgi:small subunit ribosomal protein S9